MQRQRRKDLNLKPNRVLDKRSSRGMIYENEELRLRTIHINEEVDRSQNDVKKLKKENEHLKREIWSLRDEYQKLEDMLQKVCVQTNYDQSEFIPLSGYRHGRRVSVGGDTLMTSNFDSEDDTDSRILMMDEDCKSCDSYSILDVGFGDPNQTNSGDEDGGIIASDITGNASGVSAGANPSLAVPEEDSSVDNIENLHKAGIYHHQHHHHPHHLWGHHPMASPDLEVVREESENNGSNSIHTMSVSNSPVVPATNNLSALENLNAVPESETSETGLHENLPENFEQGHLSTAAPFFNPTIEITPATSPVLNSKNETHHLKTPQDQTIRALSSEIQDVGCVANVAKTFEVTSEIRISNDTDTKSRDVNKLPNIKTASIAATTSGVVKTSTLPPQSPSTKMNISIQKMKQKHKVGSQSITNNNNNNTNVRNQNFSHRHSETVQMCKVNQDVQRTSAINQPQSQTICRQNCQRKNSVVYLRNKPSGEHDFFPILAGCCTDFHSCYQSEPSLNSLGIPQEEYFCESDLQRPEKNNNNNNNTSTGFNATFNGFDNPTLGLCHHRSHMSSNNNNNKSYSYPGHGWNSVDKNVVIGYFDENNAEINQLRSQEIIDQLETQFDPTLENIAGVRMMPGRIFLSLRTAQGVNSLLERNRCCDGVNKGKSHNELKIRGHTVRLVDASKKFSTLVLSGLPPDLSDLAVISVLNQFGQVVAPLERRIYKGVDISERICHMHLVKNLPTVLPVAGYDVLAKISHCQELSISHSHYDNPSNNKKSRTTTTTTTGNALSETSQQSQHNLLNLINNPSPPQPKSLNNPNIQRQRNSLSLSDDPEAIPVSRVFESSPTSSTQCSPAQTLKPHKPVIRSSSSAPRLETAPGTSNSALGASILAKRQMSVCAGAMSPDEHPSRLLLNANSNSINSSTSHLPPNTKKPLSRLPRSSPGSLLPPGGDAALSALTSPSTPGDKSFFHTSLCDPRRNSTASMTRCPVGMGVGFGDLGQGMGIEPIGSGKNKITPGASAIRANRMFVHNHSQMSHASPMKRRDSGFKKEPLPWCGCWGNGCI